MRFTDDGAEQVWQFNQPGDWLSQNFLCKLLSYAEEDMALLDLGWD